MGREVAELKVKLEFEAVLLEIAAHFHEEKRQYPGEISLQIPRQLG